jgi:hypothetical protein
VPNKSSLLEVMRVAALEGQAEKVKGSRIFFFF